MSPGSVRKPPGHCSDRPEHCSGGCGSCLAGARSRRGEGKRHQCRPRLGQDDHRRGRRRDLEDVIAAAGSQAGCREDRCPE